jgi:transcriptional regulator of acetoin/glycerol metabolism
MQTSLMRHAVTLLQLLEYAVDKVPCMVLLDAQGRAVARTGEPTSKERMLTSLHALTRLAERL